MRTGHRAWPASPTTAEMTPRRSCRSPNNGVRSHSRVDCRESDASQPGLHGRPAHRNGEGGEPRTSSNINEDAWTPTEQQAVNFATDIGESGTTYSKLRSLSPESCPGADGQQGLGNPSAQARLDQTATARDGDAPNGVQRLFEAQALQRFAIRDEQLRSLDPVVGSCRGRPGVATGRQQLGVGPLLDPRHRRWREIRRKHPVTSPTTTGSTSMRFLRHTPCQSRGRTHCGTTPDATP